MMGQKEWRGQQGLVNARPGGIYAHMRCCAYRTDSTGSTDFTCMYWTETAKGKPRLMLIININADLQLDTPTFKNSNPLLAEVRVYS